MTELLTAAQMRAIEAAAIASGEVTGLEMMERAGRGVVEAILEEWPELEGGEGSGGAAPTPPGYLPTENAGVRRAVVLCGPGGNGGDGFVVARLLRERGWAVEVFLYGEPSRLPPDARVNHGRWREMGEVRAFADLLPYDLPDCDLAVDALFGTGLSRPLDDGVADLLGLLSIRRDNLNPPRIVAVDVSSGLCSDSGRALYEESEWTQRFIRRRPGADLTVSFERPRVGHYLEVGPILTGRLRIVGLGIDHEDDGPLHNSPVSLARLTEPAVWFLGKEESAHKYSHGHALILSGPPGHGGAARLAARGALRIGTGVVTLGVPPKAVAEHATRLDAVMLRDVGTVAALRSVLEDKRINALCLGPGLGLDARARALVAEVLGAGDGVLEPRSTVLDADALTILAREPALFAQLHDRCILTPHGGEFARLFPDIAAKLDAPATAGPAFSKVDATREAAARAGCVVLFKGPDTVIADPSGQCSINSAHYDRAAPWLATAGSGDVLAGFVTGLLARGFAPMQAAETAAWLHVECARSFGPGLIAEDLPEELPKVFRAMKA